MTREVLITGGAGFIGARLVHRLAAHGDHVTALDDLSSGSREALPRSPRVRLVVADVRDGRAVGQAAGHADLILHLASVVGVDAVIAEPARTESVIVDGTESVLRHALSRETPLVFFSTSEVTDAPRSGPRAVYARAKAHAERRLLDVASELPVTIVRPFNVVGAGQAADRGAVLPALAAAARRGQPLPVHGDGTQTRSFLHVEDLVDALSTYLEQVRDGTAPSGEIVEVGSSRGVTIGEVASRLAVLSGTGAADPVGARQTASATREDLPRRLPDLRALRRRVAFTPRRDLDAILREVLAVA